MTRLLATGDLHIESGLSYVDDRLADHRRTLEQIAQAAFDNDVDAILLAGDIFHRPRPTPAALTLFKRFIHAIETLGIPVIAIHGNLSHDIENGDRPSALELFASDYVHVARRPEMVKGPGDVAICCLPSVPVHRLVAARDGGDRQEVYEDAAEMLLRIAAELRAEAPEGWPAVLLAHFAISGAALPSGLPTDTLNEPVLPLAGLEALGFDAIVAGHIHKPQELATVPTEPMCPIIYTGSPLCLSFGEAHVDHGVWLLEMGDERLGTHRPEFIPFDGRRFITVDIDLLAEAEANDYLNRKVAAGEANSTWGSTSDETDWVAVAIAQQFPLTDAVVRIRYRASEEQHRRVDRDSLKRLCLDAGAARVFQIVPDIVRGSRARAEHVDETVEPITALDAWVTANDVPDRQADLLRTLASELLAEQVAA